jgi:hypothetical protein
MNRPRQKRRWLAACVLPLVAATLACSITSPQITIDTTRAAATVGALAGTAQAAVSQVAPTGEALLTQAANSVPTLAAEATNLAPTLQALGTNVAPTVAAVGTAVAPTVAAAETSVATVVAGAGTAAPSGTAVYACSLMSVDEASAIAGVPASTPTAVGQICLYYNILSTTTGVALYVLPATQAQLFLAQYVPALQASGITLDQATVDKLTKDATAGDMPAALADLQALISSVKDYQIQPLDGIGSGAFWSVNTSAQNSEAALFAAKPGALVVLILRGATATQEAAAQPQMETIVKRILNSLPDNFTVVTTP